MKKIGANDMIVEYTSDGLKVKGCEYFNVYDTLSCGQVFRYKKIGANNFRVISKNKFADLEVGEDVVNIITSEPDYFYNYFDFDRDYGEIVKKLSAFSELKDAIKFGKGIRILNQNLFETIVSFIISANNNIPRIQGIIEKMCFRWGDYIADGTNEFPDISRFCVLSELELRFTGAGFRAPYIYETVRRLKDENFLEELLKFKKETKNDEERCDGLIKRLLSLKGVGRKVADCILLFGLHERSSFPTDTWVFQSSQTEELNTVEKVRKFYSKKYGDLSGYAQQYLFYYQRSKKKLI